MRGRSLQRPRREQMPPGRDSRFRNDRHTVDRERFPNFPNDQGCDYEYGDDMEQQGMHMSRRDRMREQREREPPNRQFMRYSEDRQMGMDRSPRYQRGGRKCSIFFLRLSHKCADLVLKIDLKFHQSDEKLQNSIFPTAASRVQSLDRRMMRRDPVVIEFEQEQPCKAPIYCNKYAVDDEEDDRGEKRRQQGMRSQSMPRQMQSRFGDRLMPPPTGPMRGDARVYDDNDADLPPRKGRKQNRPGKCFRSFAVVAFPVPKQNARNL